MKKDTVQFGKRILRYSIDALGMSLPYFLITFLVSVLTLNLGIAGVWLSALGVILLLTWIFKIHEGEERFYDILPAMVLSGAIITTMEGIGITIKSVPITTALEFVVGISSFYIVDTLVIKWISRLQD